MTIAGMRLELYDGINNTPALPLLVRAQHEIIEAGLGGVMVHVYWDDLAIVTFIGEEPAGVISYEHQKWAKIMYIKIGYVLPKFRRLGIYGAMWNRLVEEAQTLKAVKIRGTTHIYNEAMRATAKALGRIEDSVNLNFVVPKVDK